MRTLKTVLIGLGLTLVVNGAWAELVHISTSSSGNKTYIYTETIRSSNHLIGARGKQAWLETVYGKKNFFHKKKPVHKSKALEVANCTDETTGIKSVVLYYDNKGNVIDSWTNSYVEMTPPAPNTVGSDIFRAICFNEY